MQLLTTLPSSRLKVLYNPKAFFTHAAWLHQACAHCAIFPTAASRRSLDRVSVPVWLIILSDQLLIVALVSHYLTNKLISHGPILHRRSFPNMEYRVLAPVSRSYPLVKGRIPMYYSPVRHSPEGAFDLHVLGLPPTFALSQDQTLKLECCFRIGKTNLRPRGKPLVPSYKGAERIKCMIYSADVFLPG